MSNIFALILIATALLSPQVLKPAHLQEYDFIGEMPEILVTAAYPNEKEMKSVGMMPEVLVTASRSTSEKNITGDIPEVLITAPRYNLSESGMMPEVLITAKRYDSSRTLLVQYNKKSEKGA